MKLLVLCVALCGSNTSSRARDVLSQHTHARARVRQLSSARLRSHLLASGVLRKKRSTSDVLGGAWFAADVLGAPPPNCSCRFRCCCKKWSCMRRRRTRTTSAGLLSLLRKERKRGYLVHGEGWSVGGSDQASLCGFQHLLEAA